VTARKMTGPFTDEEVREFEKLLADPARFPGNRHERERFRKWAGDRFGAWYERGHALAEARQASGTGLCDGEAVEFFESDWYPSGMHAYFEARRQGAVYDLAAHARKAGARQAARELLDALDGWQYASAADILGIVQGWAARHGVPSPGRAEDASGR
jgi:hypothetical protein